MFKNKFAALSKVIQLSAIEIIEVVHIQHKVPVRLEFSGGYLTQSKILVDN